MEATPKTAGDTAPLAFELPRPEPELRSLLAAIVAASDDAIVSKSLDGVIRSWNRGAERLFGYTAAEAVGRPIDLIIPAALRAEEREILARLRRGETVDHFETVRVAKGGERLDVSLTISPIRDAAGRVVGASKVARDISERNRAEEALRASEQRWRAIVESQSELICRFRPDGTILFVNAAYARALDTTAEALIGQSFWSFIPAEERSKVRALVDGLTPDAPEVHIENRFEAAAGERWTLWVNRALKFDADGRVLEAQSSGIDITDRKRAEAALLDADRRKNEFLATLGHELRNPLAPMRSVLEVLLRSEPDARTLREAHEMMARQLDVVVRLVDDLLDVSRITEGKLQLRKERVDLNALVDDAAADMREAAGAARQQLVVARPDVPVYVEADAIRVSQVLTNLLSNAIRYTPEHGRIDLVVEPGPADVRISVRDTGRGIAADKLEAVFEMFSQVESAGDAGRDRGLGIGLSLVKWLVELHDGHVHATSAGPGRGSEFTVRLPRGSCAEAGEAQAAGYPAEAAAGAAYRVLVVDDNKDAAQSLAMLVEMLGHEARVVHDGPEAVEAAAEIRPRLVLLDIGLPTLSGYDVARRIRRHVWGRGIVLAAVTGWGQESDRRLALEAGCDVHVTKPLTLKALRTVLESVGAGDA